MNVALQQDIKCGIIHVIFFRDNDGEQYFLMLFELKSKPAYLKEAGMLSFPSETAKEFEALDTTVRRLWKEELGRNHPAIKYLGPANLQQFQHEMALEVVVTEAAQPFDAEPADDDVAYSGWYTRSQITKLISADAGLVRIETEAALVAAEEIINGGVYA